MIYIFDIFIADTELKIHFVKSSGAGGQNVNKLSTKAVLKWNVQESTALPEGIKKRFVKTWTNRISKKGEITLTSDKHRLRSKNLDETIKRLTEMIKKVLTPPKKRVKTRPKKSSVEKRLKEKKQHSEKKKHRKIPRHDD